MSKSFKNDNPAMAFISVKGPGKERGESTSMNGEAPPVGYRLDPRYVEVKSKKFGILLQPSVFERLKAIAEADHISVNEAINEAIKQFIFKHEARD